MEGVPGVLRVRRKTVAQLSNAFPHVSPKMPVRAASFGTSATRFGPKCHYFLALPLIADLNALWMVICLHA